MTLEELKTQVGQEVNEIIGKLVQIFPRKSGVSEFGEYSVQRICLEDESGKLYGDLWNREELTQGFVGRGMAIKSNPTKNKKTGAIYPNAPKIVQSKDGKWVNFKVSKGCFVSFGGTQENPIKVTHPDVKPPEEKKIDDEVMIVCNWDDIASMYERCRLNMKDMEKLLEQVKKGDN